MIDIYIPSDAGGILQNLLLFSINMGFNYRLIKCNLVLEKKHQCPKILMHGKKAGYEKRRDSVSANQLFKCNKKYMGSCQ